MSELIPARPASPPPLPAARPAAPAVTEEERNMGMLCHLLGIFTSFLGPLILWLVKKDQSRFIDHHGRESLNFQITLSLAMMCLGSAVIVLMFVIVGIFLMPVLFVIPILAIVSAALAAVAAQKGEWYRYPCCIRFV